MTMQVQLLQQLAVTSRATAHSLRPKQRSAINFPSNITTVLPCIYSLCILVSESDNLRFSLSSTTFICHLSLSLQSDTRAAGEEVLSALRRIIDPDFGEDIVTCGFVKDLSIDQTSGAVGFTLELTTPACPVKDQFKREATQYVGVSRPHQNIIGGCLQQHAL
jgi:metal-sulfur cluster biosynthetic enzyme